jgi:L-ectoine synthase
MIVKTFDQIAHSPAAVKANNWTSFRFLTRQDNMGFSLHETWIHGDTETEICYKHHLEAVYCIEGEGQIELKATGEKIVVRAGVMYALDQHDAHILRAFTTLRMICVFNPPLQGDEVHDAEGAYRASVKERVAYAD